MEIYQTFLLQPLHARDNKNLIYPVEGKMSEHSNGAATECHYDFTGMINMHNGVYIPVYMQGNAI